MVTEVRTLVYSLLLSFVFAFTGCVDALEPAGPGQYENPDYPSALLGYCAIPTNFDGAFSLEGRVYVLFGVSGILESFSLSDPNLDLLGSPVEKDTLVLGFQAGNFVLDQFSGWLYVEDIQGSGIYRVQLPDGVPEFVCPSESVITAVFLDQSSTSLIICYFGPEWLARKIDISTGAIQGEFHTGWPITRAAMSQDSGKLMLSNSGKEFLLEVDVSTMELADTLHLTERPGPFVYNSSANIVVFNQYSIRPRVYLYDGSTYLLIQEISSINPYQICNIIPETDVVIAPRRSENRLSVLNSANMVFAPSIYCFQSPDFVFSTENGEYIIILNEVPGMVYVYSHQ